MQNVWLQSGQRIIKQIFDWFQSSKESTFSNRVSDYAEAGVLKGALNEFDIIAGGNNTPLTPSITVRTGIAHDSNGDRIIIPDEVISYDPTLPSHTTDDGLGNPVATPYSTGNVNVPLTENANNHVYIEYLNTVDDSVFTLQKVTNAKQYYKRTDGYKITVNTSGTAPSVLAIKLGTVNLTGFGVVSGSTISTANRTYSRLQEYRTKARTVLANRSNLPATYTFDQEIFIDDHVKATGTGTVTPTNPHGMAPADIGLSGVTIEEHQRLLHVTGIYGSTSSLTGSLYPVLTQIDPGFDFVTVRRLQGSEVAVVDGINITVSDVPVDIQVNFTSLDASGNYYIYLDKFTKTILRTTTDLVTNPDSTKLLICSLTYTYPGDQGAGDGDITNFVDRRHFGHLANASDVTLDDHTTSKVNFQKQSVTHAEISSSGSGQLVVSANDNVVVKTAGLTAITVDNTLKTTTQNSIDTAIGHMQEQGFDLIPAGFIGAFGSNTVPGGWLGCDGSQVSRTTYSRLFAAIGIVHGQGNGSTTFHLPDYRGRFLRGRDNGAGRDLNVGTRTAANTGGATGDNVGSVQGMATKTPNSSFTVSVSGSASLSGSTDSSGAHQHSYAVLARIGGNQTGSNFSAWVPVADATYPTGNSPGAVNSGSNQGSHSHSVSASGSISATGTVNGGGDLETRPINANVLWIIKY